MIGCQYIFLIRYSIQSNLSQTFENVEISTISSDSIQPVLPSMKTQLSFCPEQLIKLDISSY